MAGIVYGTESDARKMVSSFCASFVDDPGLAWIWPDKSDRLTRLPHFFVPIVGGTIANGASFRSEAGDAVSLWRRPERITPTAGEMAPWHADMAKAFSSGHERSQLLGATLKAHQPDGFRWWYLQFIGVRPEAQGKGLGADVIRAGLQLAAADNAAVYVEVMNPANLGFYKHLGFETVEEFDIPDSGPRVRAMLWREP